MKAAEWLAKRLAAKAKHGSRDVAIMVTSV